MKIKVFSNQYVFRCSREWCWWGWSSLWKEGQNSWRPSCKIEETRSFWECSAPLFGKKYVKCVARGLEAPFDFEDLLRHYAPSPLNPQVLALPYSSMPAKKSVRVFCFPSQGWLKVYVLWHEFLSCMLVVGIFVFVWVESILYRAAWPVLNACNLVPIKWYRARSRAPFPSRVSLVCLIVLMTAASG